MTHRRYKRSVGATFSSSRFLRYNRRRLNPVLTQTQPAIKHSERGLARLILGAAIAGMLWLVLCRHLSGEWSINEQYSYGWFVPFFCAYLFWLRWEDRPTESELRIAETGMQKVVALSIVAFALILLLPLRVFEIGNPDWRPLGWIHAGVVVTITLLAIWAIGGVPWLRHFAFPIAFILVAVPWVTPIEAPIVQGLMRLVAAVAAEAVNLCGIPAQLEGNLIRVSNGLVGVSEACSGVRALQTALMIGLLFGELKRFTVARRATLVAVAIALSMVANFFRTFFLVLIAARDGVNAVDRWHDFAGYSIVALVFVGTMAAAALLGRRQKSEDSSIKPQTSNLKHVQLSSLVTSFPNFSFLLSVLAWLVLVELAAAGWYRAHEHGLVPRTRWSVSWPTAQSGFRDLKIDETVRQTLRFDEGRAARWYVAHSPSQETNPPDLPRLYCTLFFFRWNPGGGTLLRARAHRPDICLPSSGWEEAADNGVRLYETGSNLALPFRHFEFVRKRRGPFEHDQFAHTFFCLQQDWLEGKNSTGARTALASNSSRDWGVTARVRAVEDGLRDLGQQSLKLIMIVPRPLEAAAAEAKFAELLPGLIKGEGAKRVTSDQR